MSRTRTEEMVVAVRRQLMREREEVLDRALLTATRERRPIRVVVEELNGQRTVYDFPAPPPGVQ